MKKIVLMIFVLSTVIAFAQMSAPASPKAALPAVYQKWLDEDVSYIIAPEERQSFFTLKDDSERDQFVRQFWLRRDPTTGTEENEYKEEHYRRLAYANVHFASKLPGWKTDRGRTYIVLGPPDQIAGGKNSLGVPHEVWSYGSKHSAVVFEDRCRCGEYELVN